LESIPGLLKRLQIRGQEVTSWHNKEVEIVGTHKRMGREKKNISFNLQYGPSLVSKLNTYRNKRYMDQLCMHYMNTYRYTVPL